MTPATEVKAKPIIFSGDSVRAILAGKKSVTRRVVKPQPPYVFSEGDVSAVTNGDLWAFARLYAPGRGVVFPPNDEPGIRCPYGRVGDRLWCKEKWQETADEYGTPVAYYASDDTVKMVGRHLDETDFLIEGKVGEVERPDEWRSPLFMPRWASRLTLEITAVWVERVQGISEADAIAEGYDQKQCAEVFDIAAGKFESEYSRHVEDDDGNDSGEDYCYDCAEIVAKETRREVHGYDDYHESDGPAFCDRCHKAINLSLTTYGVERELRIEDDPDGKEPKYFPVSGNDARVVATIACGIGDLRQEHHGRLAQIGFATAWNQINAKRGFPWKSNPWVWVVEFRRDSR